MTPRYAARESITRAKTFAMNSFAEMVPRGGLSDDAQRASNISDLAGPRMRLRVLQPYLLEAAISRRLVSRCNKRGIDLITIYPSVGGSAN
jgi:hypothetical protein